MQSQNTGINKKISSKFSSIQIALFLCIAIVMIFFVFVNVFGIIEKISKDYAQLYTTRVTGILNTNLGREITLMTKAANSPALVEWFTDEGNEQKKKDAFIEISSTLDMIKSEKLHFIIAESGNEYSIMTSPSYSEFTPYTKISKDNPEDVWYFECLNANAPYLLNVDIEKTVEGTNTKHQKKVWLNYRVIKNGVPVGVIATGLAFNNVLEELFGEYDHSVRSYIIDNTGTVQMVSILQGDENDVIYERSVPIWEYIEDSAFADTLKNYLLTCDGMFAAMKAPKVAELSNSKYKYAAFSPLAGTNWVVVSFYNSSDLFSLEHFLPMIVIIIGLFVVYLLASSYMNRILLIKPINELVGS